MSEQNNNDRMKEITKQLEEGVVSVFRSGQFDRYLKVMSRFPTYSMNNQLLIYLQNPEATKVAGYRAWQNKFHRNVVKGAKGIQIIAPIRVKRTVQEFTIDEEGKAAARDKEITVSLFKPTMIFDVSQTEGEPLPELVSQLKGDVENFPQFLQALVRTAGIPVTFEQLPREMDGYYEPDKNEIVLRDGMSEVQTVCALVHELTHARLHGKDREGEEKPQRTREVEAESVSYAVCSYYGIETGENSFGYIASWSENRELKELKASLETISKTSCELIREIDQNYCEISLELQAAEKEETVLAEHHFRPPVIAALNECREIFYQAADQSRASPGMER